MRSTFLLIAATIALAVGSQHLAGVIGVPNHATLTIPSALLLALLAMRYRSEHTVLAYAIACVALCSISAVQDTFSLLQATICGIGFLVFVAAGLYEVGLKQPEYRYWSAFALTLEGLAIWNALLADDSLLLSIGVASGSILVLLGLQYFMPDTSRSHTAPAALS